MPRYKPNTRDPMLLPVILAEQIQPGTFEFALDQPSAQVASELMQRAIDSARGRQIYSQRIATVEPVFANIRYNKKMDRFNLRGKDKVATQWHLYCLVHNIEKLARSGYNTSQT